MSSSYDSSRSRRRGLWSFWVPVVVTVTVATAGVAAWAWSQRDDDEEEEHDNNVGLDYENADYGDNPAYGALKDAENTPFARGPGSSYGITDPQAEATGASAGWGAQMSGALRRTPSPQQFLSDAGKRVAASVVGMGAAVGSALAAIREEDKTAYADHETWSEEAEARKERPPAPLQSQSQSQSRDVSKRRRTVAIVVSADTNIGELEGGGGIHEHAVSPHRELCARAGHGADANRCTVHPVPHSPKHRLFQYQAVRLDLLTGSEGCCSRRPSHS